MQKIRGDSGETRNGGNRRQRIRSFLHGPFPFSIGFMAFAWIQCTHSNGLRLRWPKSFKKEVVFALQMQLC
jgi:hypothetical protein